MVTRVGVMLAATLAALSMIAADASHAQRQPDAAAPAAVATPPGPAGARLSPGQPIPPAELEAFVDGVAAQAMAQKHIGGAAVTVVQNGQIILKKGYGVDRLSPARPVDPDRTLFRIGSITKTFTWIALMREIEAGHVRLDAPVNIYLPQKNQIKDQGFKRPVLVRDLMTHSSGFESRTFGQLIEKNPVRIRPLDVYLRQERPRRVREPGQFPSYSNYGAALAGEAVVYSTGRTMQALVEREITGPLGLHRTTLREPYPARADLPAPMDPGLAADMSEGYRWTGSGLQARPTEYLTQAAPAGAASSTATDMARYMLAILGDGTLEGATLYSPAIAKDFRTTLMRSAPGVRGWDYGVNEYDLPGGFKGFGQGGGTLSFNTDLVTVPQLGLGVFAAANTDTSAPFVDSLPLQIVQRFYAAPAQTQPPASDWLRQNADAFRGSYLTTDRAYRGLEGFVDLLHADFSVSVSKDGVLLVTSSAGPTRWTPDAAASLDAPYVAFHQVGGPDTLVFEMKDGRARRWFPPSGAAAFERSGVFSDPRVMAALALATTVAAIAAIAGLFMRNRRDFRQTSIQGRADAAQVSGSILWLVTLTCFGIWMLRSTDTARLMYNWPGALLMIASASALVASVLTLICLGLLPVVWRGGRRLDSWTNWRKSRFTITTVIFTLLGVLIGLWGGLQPWSP